MITKRLKDIYFNGIVLNLVKNKNHLLVDGAMFQKLSKIKYLYLVVGLLLNRMIYYHLIPKNILFKKSHVLKNLNQEEDHLLGFLVQILLSILDLMENILMINGLST